METLIEEKIVDQKQEVEPTTRSRRYFTDSSEEEVKVVKKEVEELKSSEKEPKVFCTFFNKTGSCKKGDSCPYVHDNSFSSKKSKNVKKPVQKSDKKINNKPLKSNPINKKDGGNGGNPPPIVGGGGGGDPPHHPVDGNKGNAGGAAKPKVTNYKDIKSYFMQRKIFVFPSSKMVREVERNNLGEQVKFKNTMSENRHACSALHRELAITYVLKCEGSGKKNLVVEDFYGSNRNNRICNSDSIDVNVKFVQTADYHIQGDRARGFDNRTQEEQVGCDFGLVEDVYENGPRPLEPIDILRLCDRTVKGIVYVIKRDFVGYAGVDSKHYEEGNWIRLENGKILFSPSPSEQLYTPHAALDWILGNRSYKGVDIAMVHQAGPYSIYRLAPTNRMAIEIDQPGPQAGVFEFVKYRVPYTVYGFTLNQVDWFHDNVCSYIPVRERNELVHYPTFLKKNKMMQNKSLRGSLYDHVDTVVVHEFESDPMLVQLSSRFPAWYKCVLESTTKAILFAGRYDKSLEYEETAEAYRVSEKRLEESRVAKTVVQENTGKAKKIVCGIVALSVLSYGATRFSKSKTEMSASWNPFFKFLSKLAVKIWKLSAFSLSRLIKEMWKHFKVLLALGFTYLCKAIHYVSWIFNPEIGNSIRKNTQIVMHKIENGVTKLKNYNVKDLRGGVESSIKEIDSSNRMSSRLMLNAFISPLFEEIVRENPLLSMFLTSIELYKKRGNKKALLVSTLFHGIFSLAARLGVSLEIRFVMHFWWNLVAMCASRIDLTMSLFGSQEEMDKINRAMQNFEDYDLEEPITYMPKNCVLDTTNARPPLEYVLEERVKETIKIRFNGQNITDFVSFGKYLYDMSHTEEGIWLLLSPQVMLLKPTNSPINWWIAVMTRVFKEPYDIPKTKEEKHELLQVWTVIKNLFIANLDYIYSTKYDIYDVRKIVGKKAQRLVDALDRKNKSGNQIEYTKSISVKTDETLPKRVDYPFFRPRAITQFSPTFLGETCPVSREMADILHEIFQVRNLFHIYNYTLAKLIPCTFTFGSGYTAEELDDWLDQALMMSDAIHFIVAGDDCAILWGPWASVFGFCGENDFSTYEFTQGPHCFVLYEAVMSFYIDNKQFVTKVMDSFQKAYQCVKNVKGEVIRVKADITQRMASGSSDTTNFNSIGNIGSAMHIIQNTDFRHSPEFYYDQVGFKCKYKRHDNLTQMTFLKGWWQLDVRDKYRWIPLPGMVLKIGKTKRDPTKIAKNKDRDEANKICAYALASSPGFVPLDYPLFGRWLVTMKKLGTISNIKLYARFERTVRSQMYQINRAEALESIFLRYGLYKSEIEEIEELLSSIVELPVVVSHTALKKLMIDYS